MNWRGWLLSCTLALAVFPVADGAADNTGWTPVDAAGMALLRAGEWILNKDLEDANGATASIVLFFRAPAERIWGIIISCDYAMSWVDGLEYCEVLQDRGDYALIRQVVDKGWASPRIDYTFEVFRIPFQTMQLKLKSGNLKTFQGSWDFTSLPDGVLLRYTLALQPEFPVPRWLVRQTLTHDMPDMMLCLRGLAQGSGSDSASASERRRCPGAVKENHHR
jgi:Polyketide cyclase / dehydrase and lipid transport